MFEVHSHTAYSENSDNQQSDFVDYKGMMCKVMRDADGKEFIWNGNIKNYNFRNELSDLSAEYKEKAQAGKSLWDDYFADYVAAHKKYRSLGNLKYKTGIELGKILSANHTSIVDRVQGQDRERALSLYSTKKDYAHQQYQANTETSILAYKLENCRKSIFENSFLGLFAEKLSWS